MNPPDDLRHKGFRADRWGYWRTINAIACQAAGIEPEEICDSGGVESSQKEQRRHAGGHTGSEDMAKRASRSSDRPAITINPARPGRWV